MHINTIHTVHTYTTYMYIQYIQYYNAYNTYRYMQIHIKSSIHSIHTDTYMDIDMLMGHAHKYIIYVIYMQYILIHTHLHLIVTSKGL
jgi:hypothetical protein